MHPLLIFLYCSAMCEDSITQHKRDVYDTFIHCFFPDAPSTLFHPDPCVMLSVFHSQFQPTSYHWDDIIHLVTHDISPKTWGPALWSCLYTLASSAQFQNLSLVLPLLVFLMPCHTCTTHLNSFLAQNPPAFVTSTDASTYVRHLHSTVNMIKI